MSDNATSARRSDAARDLGLHMMQDVEKLLNRHMTIAAMAVEPWEMVMMVHDLAVGTALGSLFFATMNADAQTDVSDFYDTMAQGITAKIASGKPQVLGRLNTTRATA